MKTRLKEILVAQFICLFSSVSFGATTNTVVTPEAIQAIQQAPDPSAAVSAYANGVAADRNNPKVYDAYVARMVDFGLPEIAYRQAQTLTTLAPENGLAWGVLAFVDARRGEMTDAVSEISLAGQFAPDNKLIQRTAGEILAWYDTRADKADIPDNAKDGLARLRDKMGSRAEFALAYDTAQKAYKAQAEAAPPPAPAAGTNAPAIPPQSQAQPAEPLPETYVQPYATGPAPVSATGPAPAYATVAPAPAYYYDDYYYGYGPGWVAPSSYWWWRPYGYFHGFDFYPFSTVFVFGHGYHHHGKHHGHGKDWHHGHHGDGFRWTGKGIPPSQNGQFFRRGAGGDRRVAQTGAANSRNSAAFFGTPARPDPRLGRQRSGTSFQTTPGLVSPGRPARPQNGFIPRPGTSTAPAAPAPNPTARQRSAVPASQPPSLASPRLPSGARVVTPPAATAAAPATRNATSQPRSLATLRNSAGASRPATVAPVTPRSPTAPMGGTSVRQGTPITGRGSSAAVAAQRPASAPMRNPFVSGSTARPSAPAASRSMVMPSAPSRPAPVARAAPSAGFRSAPMSTPRSSPMVAPRSAPMSVPRSSPMVAPSRSFSAPAARPSFSGRSFSGGGAPRPSGGSRSHR